MRWIAVLALSLAFASFCRAAGPDDDYLDIYNQVIQADNLQKSGHPLQAAGKYLEAQSALRRLKTEHPTWNTEIVDFRLDYVAEQLAAIGKAAPAAPGPPPVAVTPAKAATEAANAAAEISKLQEQIRSLTAANGELENKLKEALSVQPAAVSPRELAKAQEKASALQKENDLLTVALQQAKAAKQPITPSPEPENTARQLADAKQALADLKARSAQETQAAQAEIERLKDSLAEAQKKISANTSQTSVKEITAERDRLKEELAVRTKDLADAESRRDLVELRTRLAESERQRDELKTKLAAAPTASPATVTDAQVDQLRARLAVLEAQAVPYTPDELAVLKKNQSSPPNAVPTAPAEHKPAVHSLKDLPPGAREMIRQAEMEHDYAKAAETYQQILRQDENNVYVLSYLGNAQFALNELTECEKTVNRALALDPNDAASLYLLGILRYRQERLDDALNALSLSVKYNPTNAGTQNYLGCVLADKGLRPAAETAFRKALALEPDYPDANFNLALLYAEEKPPALELARLHYQRSVERGHKRSDELEKLLAPTQ
jgi:tetratricopeptide (TPR) repeat protein